MLKSVRFFFVTRFGAFFIYCTGTGKKIFTLLHLPSHLPLRSRAAGSRRTRRVRMKQRTKETKARFRVRSLPGLRGKNGRQIRTQRGPLTPKPPSFSSEQTRVCGFLECTKIYWPVYNVLRSLYWLAPVEFSWSGVGPSSAYYSSLNTKIPRQ